MYMYVSMLKCQCNSIAIGSMRPECYNQLNYSFSAGKGTFGVVLQARAEDIVKSAPQRNIVAVKTPRSMYWLL